LAVPFYIFVERPFRNFLDLILFPKSSIFKKMKDVDDDDDDEKSSSDEDAANDAGPYNKTNEDVSDDGGESIPVRRRNNNAVVCGYCIHDKCDCRCLVTKKRCKCMDKLDKSESMQFTPGDRSNFLAMRKRETDTSSEAFNPNSYKSKGLLGDKRVSFDVPKKV
jgi:hypothetical protein